MNKYKLGELIEINNGTRYSHLQEGEIPLYGSGGLMSYVNDYLYDGKAVLLPRKGTLTNIMYTEGKIWTVDTMYYAKVNEKANAYYLYSYLSLLNLAHLDSGSALPSMTRWAYDNIEVILPSIKAQNEIADLLQSFDAKIELNNKINQELEAMAKMLYDYWFVQFDFPFDFAQGKPNKDGKPYKSSGGKMVYNEELKREIPEGWEVKELGEISEIKRGTLVTAKTADLEGEIKVVSAGLDYSYLHSESNRERNTITVSSSGANAGFINFWREPIFANDCTTVRGKTDVETLIYLQFLKMRQDHIFKQARGSAQPHVYPQDLSILKIELPNNDLFKLYGEKVLSANEIITNNLKQNQKLAELRDWLLPMLMNGQVKVEDGYVAKNEVLGMVAEDNAIYE